MSLFSAFFSAGEVTNYLDLHDPRDPALHDPRESGQPSRHDVYRMVVAGFRNPWITLSYLVAQAFLCLHLWHGAWSFFQLQPAGYRRTATHWVVSAKREDTRRKRLTTLIEDSANGRRLQHLTRP